MGRRTWIKIYSEKWLRGTLREETPATRGIWIDVLALAGDSFYGDNGIIKFSKNMGFTDEQISDLLHITIQDWQTAKKRLIKTDRIKINENNIISIINWSKYQSEYERQKKYRSKNEEKSEKLQSGVTAKVTKRKEKREKRKDIKKILSKDNRNPDLQKIIDYAQEKGFSLQGSQQQNRRYAYNLLRKKDGNNEPLGKDRVIQLIDMALAAAGEPYSPTINDFVSLYKKWVDLLSFIERKKSGGRVG